MDGNIEYDSYKDLYIALWQFGRSQSFSTVLHYNWRKKGRKAKVFFLIVTEQAQTEVPKALNLNPSGNRKIELWVQH